MTVATPIRAARGTQLSARGWQQEAALRMLCNNLDPDVAERPQDLVVYGGTGKAARDWPSFYAIVVARPKRHIRKAIAQSRFAAKRLRNRIRSEWIRFRARPSPSSYPPTLPS